MRLGAARLSRSRATAATTAAAAAAAAARATATASTSVAASAAAATASTSVAASAAAGGAAAVTVSGAAAVLAACLGHHRFRSPVLERERAPRAEACGATTGALGSASMLAAAAVQRSGPSTGPSVPPLLARVCAPHDTSTPLGFHSSGRRRVCAALAGVFLMAYLCVYCLTCSGAVRCGREQVLRATLHGHSRRSAVFDLLAQPARFPVCFCLSCVVSRILS